MTALRIVAHALWITLVAIVGLTVVIAALAIRAFAPVSSTSRHPLRYW